MLETAREVAGRIDPERIELARRRHHRPQARARAPPTTTGLRADARRVFHLAAIYDLAVPLEIAQRVNVDGTGNVLDFCARAEGLERLAYVSPAYVAGMRTGVVYEHELVMGQAFKNHYESTKFQAEVWVRELLDRVPTTILRPAIVVGDSRTGETEKFDGPYYILRALAALAADGPGDAAVRPFGCRLQRRPGRLRGRRDGRRRRRPGDARPDASPRRPGPAERPRAGRAALAALRGSRHPRAGPAGDGRARAAPETRSARRSRASPPSRSPTSTTRWCTTRAAPSTCSRPTGSCRPASPSTRRRWSASSASTRTTPRCGRSRRPEMMDAVVVRNGIRGAIAGLLGVLLFGAAPAAAAKQEIAPAASYPGMTTYNCRTDPIPIYPGQNLNLSALTKTCPNAEMVSGPGDTSLFAPGSTAAGLHHPLQAEHGRDPRRRHAGRRRASGTFTSITSSGSSPAGARRSGSGEEKTEWKMPQGYGFKVGGDATWGLNYMIHSLTASTAAARSRSPGRSTGSPRRRPTRTDINPLYSPVARRRGRAADLPGLRRRARLRPRRRRQVHRSPTRSRPTPTHPATRSARRSARGPVDRAAGGRPHARVRRRPPASRRPAHGPPGRARRPRCRVRPTATTRRR